MVPQATAAARDEHPKPPSLGATLQGRRAPHEEADKRRPDANRDDRLVFASSGELAVGRPLPGDSGDALPDSSAFAALWRDLEIPAQGSRTVSYEYGRTSGWPAP